MTEILTKLSQLFVDRPNQSHNEGTLELIPTKTFRLGLHECRTVHELNRYLENFLKFVKWALTHPKITDEQTVCLLQQALYCRCLGSDVDFITMYAIQMASRASVCRHKTIAYQACMMLLNESSQMAIMMISTLLNDIKCQDETSVCLALSAASQMVSAEFIPALDGPVAARITHSISVVRRKALLCLSAFIRKCPELLSKHSRYLKMAMCHRDPYTMWAAVELFDQAITSECAAEYTQLITPLLSILQQTLQGRLPAGLSRGPVAAPFVISATLRLVTRLSVDDSLRSRSRLAILPILDRYEGNVSYVAVSVCAQCCESLITLGTEHGDKIASYAAKLLHPNSVIPNELRNYQLTGLRLLKSLASMNKGLMVPHQKQIVTLLSCTEPNVAQASLSLILSLTNAANSDWVYQLYQEQCSRADRRPEHTIQIILAAPPSAAWLIEKIKEVNDTLPSHLLSQISNRLIAMTQEKEFRHELTTIMKQSLSGELSVTTDVFLILCHVLSELQPGMRNPNSSKEGENLEGNPQGNPEECLKGEMRGEEVVTVSCREGFTAIILRYAEKIAHSEYRSYWLLSCARRLMSTGHLSPSQEFSNRLANLLGVHRGTADYVRDIASISLGGCDDNDDDIVLALRSYTTSRLSDCRSAPTEPKPPTPKVSLTHRAEPPLQPQSSLQLAAGSILWTERGRVVSSHPHTAEPMSKADELASQIFSAL